MASNDDNRKHFAFIIYGASGFTGKYCIEYMVKCIQKLGSSHSWAIAGRNASRLIAAKNDVANILGVRLDDIPVIVADINDEDSLYRMCKQCNVVLNCVGPYAKYGEAVVKACIKAKTHQVDLAGEIQYMGQMQLKYHKQAEEAGVLIVNCCGFGSLIWEVGINYLKDASKPKVLNSVEYYVGGMFSTRLHQGTYDSFVEMFSNLSKVLTIRNRVRNEIYTKPMPQFDYPHQKRMIPFYSEDCKGWCVNTLLEGSIVEQAQHFNYVQRNERPTQIDTYVVVPNFLALCVFSFISLLVLLFTRCSCGVRLLTKYARWFTLWFVTPEGPTREEIMRSSFELTFFGKGWRNDKETNKAPDVETVAVIKGPNGPYVTGSICMVNAAFTIQEEFGTESIPLRGGVVTPGVAFRSTQIVDRLIQNSITFSVLK